MGFIEMKDIHKVYGEEVLAIDEFNLSIEKNEFVALIGPSGCGKSTLLRMISGLESITYGDLVIDGKRMNDVHAKDRGMSMVFQNYALYPHMTNFNNIGFGLKLQKEKKAVIEQRVNEVAATLGLTDHLEKNPSELSGGQRQRVALGRAMVQESKIFLMDEPLSNLDAKLRNKMRMEILRLHRELDLTTIYVTHDQIEAMTMADKIVLMKDGVIQQIGTPRELYFNPNNLFVARFIGEPEMNMLPVEVRGDELYLDGAHYPIPESLKNRLADYQGKELLMGIRPEDIRTENVYLTANPEKVLATQIELVEMRGDSYIVFAEIHNQLMTIKVPSHEIYEIGDRIQFVFNMNKALLFDEATGERIR